VPAFRYTAVDSWGRRITGWEEASAGAVLEAELRRRGLWVLEVTTEVDDRGARLRLGRSYRRAVLVLTRSMASLLRAGLPLARALRITRAVVGGPAADALGAIEAAVARGVPLHAALAVHDRLFPALYVGLIRAGERSGNLAGAFSRLASYLEQREALRQRLLSASIYPLLLAGAGGVAIAVLLLFVLPQFVELLEGAGASLPSTTSFLLAVAEAARSAWLLFVLLPVSVLGIALWHGTTEQGRRAGAMLLLRLPLVSELRRRALGARFAYLVATLLGGGAPLLHALKDTAESIGDPVHDRFFEPVLINGRMAVRDGAIKTFPLRGIKDSPPYLHDGRLPTLADAVEFFNIVLQVQLTEQEKQDLLAFLYTL